MQDIIQDMRSQIHALNTIVDNHSKIIEQMKDAINMLNRELKNYHTKEI